MKQQANLPIIIGAIVLLLVVVGVLGKIFLSAGDTVNPAVGGPPAYAKQSSGGGSPTYQPATAGKGR